MTPEEFVAQWHGEQPHPRAPSVKVKDYPAAAKMATVLHFGKGYAQPQEVEHFWAEYQGMNQNLQMQGKAPYTPEEFIQMAKQMATSSFAFHGRPPAMAEIARLKDAHPKDVHGYYASLPDQNYPTVSAGDMAKAMHSAQPWAQMILNREPNKSEAAYLAHTGEHPRSYYGNLKNNGNQDQAVGYPGVAGPGAAGGRPPDQRVADTGVAPGAAAAGR